ncbi:MAG: leucine-rich repeat domain-containing protein [Metamycoplasmataceae bacterium]
MKLTKKILPIGLLSVSIIPLAIVSCSTGEKATTYFESEGFKISSKGEIMGFANIGLLPAGAINIKEKYNGVTITSIANDAFKGQVNITEVILPSTLESIGSNAFFDVGSPIKLPEVNDPNEEVIWDLSHLANLKEIGDYAFAKPEPTTITPVPSKWNIRLNLNNLSNLERIGIGSFTDRGIYKIDFPTTSNIKIIDEKAFSYNKIINLKIPNSVITIGRYAFQYNKLNSVTIPNSITSISNGTFYNNELIKIDIPNSVTSIGTFAFGYNKITSIIIPNSIKIIEDGTFSDNKLTKIDIPNSVTSIGDYAFNTNLLTFLSIPNSVITIGRSSFSSNPLTSLNVPDSVINIGDDAFLWNKFTDNAMIKLPAKFNNAANRRRIGIELPLKENELNNKPKLEAPLETIRRKKEAAKNNF